MTYLSQIRKWREEKEARNTSYHKHTFRAAQEFMAQNECPECKAKKRMPGRRVSKFDEELERTRVPFVELGDGRLAEMAFDGETVYFLVYDPKEDKVSREEKIRGESIVYRPLDNNFVRNRQVLLPSGVEEYVSDEKLFKEIYDFLSKWHVADREWEKKLDALYVMFTWIYDKMPVTPYRRMIGPKGTGKSTWLHATGEICYRPLILSGASTDASFKRLIDTFRGTLLIDESDFNNSSLYSTIIQTLNVGFDKRSAYLTACDKEDPSQIDSFYVYGPKLLVTRRNFQDDALESRCITTTAIKGRTMFLGNRFSDEAERLRNSSYSGDLGPTMKSRINSYYLKSLKSRNIYLVTIRSSLE